MLTKLFGHRAKSSYFVTGTCDVTKSKKDLPIVKDRVLKSWLVTFSNSYAVILKG